MEGVGMGRIAQRQLHAEGPDTLFPGAGHIFPAHEFAVDAEALPIVEEMGTHERARPPDRAKGQFQKAAGGAFAARARHMDQAGGMAVGPKRGNGLAQELQPRHFGRRPLGVVDLVDDVVIGKIEFSHAVAQFFGIGTSMLRVRQLG